MYLYVNPCHARPVLCTYMFRAKLNVTEKINQKIVKDAQFSKIDISVCDLLFFS